MVDRIGFLLATNTNDWARYINWFVGALQHPLPRRMLPPMGANGDADLILEAAQQLANDRDVKVIVTAGTGAALACKAATQMNRKPVVFASVGNPSLSGLVPVPGSKDNFTGGDNRQADERVVHRRVDYMLSDAAFLGPFAIVGDHSGNNPMIKTAMDLAYDYLTKIQGQSARIFSITSADDIAGKVADMKTAQMRSMYVCSDLFLTVKSTLLNREAHNPQPYAMRTMFEFEEHVQGHGGDDYYGSDFEEMFKKAASYVDEILDNAQPSDLPIYIARLKGSRQWPIFAKKQKPKPKQSARSKK